MKTTHTILKGGACAFIAAFSLITAESRACGGGYLCAQAGMAQDAVGADREKATKAIAQLRANGQIGLDALFATHRDEITRLREIRAGRKPGVSVTRTALEEVLDQVSQQRDCLFSQLYWYTDLEAAEQMAKASGKPILSLRLLGKLSDEISCANSRYFRTILYADSSVAEYLRNSFVLHWESERPVPKVTIDFGDGRKLERTVTGNSIHYILDADGRVVDAIPGLFAAKQFREKLAAAEKAQKAIQSLQGNERELALKHYHAEQLRDSLRRWNSDLSRLAKAQDLPAINAQSLAEIVPALAVQRATLEKVSDDDSLTKIAFERASDYQIGVTARDAVASKMPTAEQAGRKAASKTMVETPLLRAMRNLQNSLARDSVRNDYLLHSRIHQWLATGEVPRDLAVLNQRVYSELFLTPRNDPWLGLEAPDGFAALPNDGEITAGTTFGAR